MKKKVLVSLVLLLIMGGCSRRKDCDCIQQKYSRHAIYTIPSLSNNWNANFIGATNWKEFGNSYLDDNDNCQNNGRVLKSESHLKSTNLFDHTEEFLEIEQRIICQ